MRMNAVIVIGMFYLADRWPSQFKCVEKLTFFWNKLLMSTTNSWCQQTADIKTADDS